MKTVSDTSWDLLTDHLSDFSERSVNGIIEEISPAVRSMLALNAATMEEEAHVMESLIMELYIKFDADFDFKRFEKDRFLSSLVFYIYKKHLRNDKRSKKQLLLDRDVYDPAAIRLEYHKCLAKEEVVLDLESVLGEPERTIMKLCFHGNETEEDMMQHFHFDSADQLKSRKLKIFDKCIDLIG